jgi:hypothetical protein
LSWREGAAVDEKVMDVFVDVYKRTFQVIGEGDSGIVTFDELRKVLGV